MPSYKLTYFNIKVSCDELPLLTDFLLPSLQRVSGLGFVQILMKHASYIFDYSFFKGS